MPIELYGANASLYECRDEEVLLEGGAGAGKTIGAMKKLVDACYQYPRSRHLLCRQTRESITESALVTLESVIGDSHPEVMRVKKENRHSYVLNGSDIVLAGLNEPAKAFGTAWGIVVLEEAIEADLGAWELFGRAARNPRLIRSESAGAFPYHQRIAITNPGPPKHWLNVRASPCADTIRRIESYADLARLHAFNDGPQSGPMRRLVAVRHDNPTFFDVDAWRWTEAGRKYLVSLNTMSGHNLAIMRDGLWVAASGGVFAGDFTSANVCKPFRIPSDWPIYVYCDPGRDHPCAILWFAISPTGTIFIIHESYQRGMSVQQHAEIIHKANMDNGWGVAEYYLDPRHGFKKTMESPVSIAEQFEEFGLTFSPWLKTQGTGLESSVELVRTKFKNRSLIIFDIVENGIAEVQSWRYKRNSRGEQLPGDEKYEDKNNHAIDTIRAACIAGHTYTHLDEALTQAQEEAVLLASIEGEHSLGRE